MARLTQLGGGGGRPVPAPRGAPAFTDDAARAPGWQWARQD